MKALIKPTPILFVTLFFIGAIFLLSFGHFASSHASETGAQAVFTVDSELDAVDSNLGDGICQTAEGTCTLRAAIQEANTTEAADAITLPVGTYMLSISGTKEDNAAFGDLDIINPVTISGVSAEETIISGNALDRVFHNLAETTMSNLTIRDGVKEDDLFGSAIHNVGPLLLQSVTITNNLQAGEIDFFANRTDAIYTTGSLVIKDSLIAQNHTGLQVSGDASVEIVNSVFRDNDDGAIRGVRGESGQTISVSIQDSQIVSNTSFFKNAGIHLSGASLTIKQTIIDGNRNSVDGPTGASGNSGGIFIGNGSLTILNSTLSNNFTGVSTSTHGGGGISIYDSEVLIRDTLIESNTSDDGPGGGILISNGSMEIIDSSIINNNAREGAGIHVMEESQVKILNSTVSGNVADLYGGGIFNGDSFFENDDSMTLIVSSTIVNNTAEGDPESGTDFANGRGAGVWNSEMVVLYQSVVANNTADEGADCFSVPVMLSLGYNLIEDGSCPLSGDTVTNFLNTDPMLDDLADNGGGVMTHLPQNGSLLIDAGNPAGCLDADFNLPIFIAEVGDDPIIFDQRGYSRTVDGNGDSESRCDIGAVEALSTPPVLDKIIYLPTIFLSN